MTGFARAEVAGAHQRFVWEAKSVNARGLEVRMRLPVELEHMDPAIRQACRKTLTRGNCFFTLHQERGRGAASFRVNQELLDIATTAALAAAEREGVAPPSADGLLRVRGVIEEVGPLGDNGDEAELESALLAGLEDAIAALKSARSEEGERLKIVLLAHLEEMDRLHKEAAKICDESVDLFKERISEQIETLKGAGLDSDRLYQEAVLAATKADVREEVDRLAAHIAAAKSLLDQNQAVGRRLDFLAQELNREANTLCSKAYTNRLSALGIELKALIDQFREQVQNVE